MNTKPQAGQYAYDTVTNQVVFVYAIIDSSSYSRQILVDVDYPDGSDHVINL